MKAARSMWGWTNPPGFLPDTAHPAVRRASVEALAVPPMQDRALEALAEHEVDRAGYPGHQGYSRRLVAFAHDAQSTGAGHLHNRRTGIPVQSAPVSMRMPTRTRTPPSTRRVEKGCLGASGGRCGW